MEQGIEIRAVRHPSGRSVIPDDAEFVGDFIEAFPPDTVFTMSLKKYRKRRSKGAPDEDGNQLGYFFGIVVPKWQNEILHCLKKEEAYYFPEDVDLGPHPETFFGVHPSIVEQKQYGVLLPYRVEWKDDLPQVDDVTIVGFRI